MAEPQIIRPSYCGRLVYDQNRCHTSHDYFRGRRQRPHILRVAYAHDEWSIPLKPRKSHANLTRVKKLISNSEPAKRLFRLVSSSASSLPGDPAKREEPRGGTPQLTRRNHESSGTLREREIALDSPAREPPVTSDMAFGDHMRLATASPRGSVSASAALQHRPGLSDGPRRDSAASTGSTTLGSDSLEGTAFENAKPIASGNGVSVFVAQAEPVIFLSGFESADSSARSTAMLRGSLLLRVAKSAKIKTVSMKFRGRAETHWPEGIPPKRAEFKDTYSIIDHTFSFYDCNMGNSEHHGAHTYVPAKNPAGAGEGETQLVAHGFEQFRKTGVFESITNSRDGRRMSLQNTHVKSLGKGEAGPNPAHKGYRIFTPGDYFYNFELPIDSRYPETINVELGNVKYELEATVERAGAFRANLVGAKEVQLVRAPSGESLEAVEPIAISRDWEDQLHYDIVISGKSFPLGSQVPIAFKLTPLAKVQCHRLKVFITENIQYFTKDKKVHRMEPTRKLQLFEKRADSPSNSAFPGSTLKIISGGGVSYDDRDRAARGEENVQRDQTNLLGHLEDEYNVGPTEMEMSVHLPSCFNMPEKDKNQRIHFDTTYSNIQVHHWIKIVMRLSKDDPENPGKRRHFEISIDSPLNILSCRSTRDNTTLPSYSSRDASVLPADEATCGCPGAPTVTRRRTGSGSGLNLRRPGSSSQLRNAISTSSIRNLSRPSSAENSPNASTHDLTSSIAPPPAAHVAGGQPAPSNQHPPTSSASSSSTNLQAQNQMDAYDEARDNNRPIHLLRQPSFNPPSFDDSDPPPPLVTPPPRYETEFGNATGSESGLVDYFQRLADEIDVSDDGQAWAHRMEIPLTPGGRVNRSMDEVRAWRPVVP